jgi:hypothetical protein
LLIVVVVADAADFTALAIEPGSEMLRVYLQYFSHYRHTDFRESWLFRTLSMSIKILTYIYMDRRVISLIITVKGMEKK